MILPDSDAVPIGVLNEVVSLIPCSSMMTPVSEVPPALSWEGAGAASGGESPKLYVSACDIEPAKNKRSHSESCTYRTGAGRKDYEADNLFFGYTLPTGRGG